MKKVMLILILILIFSSTSFSQLSESDSLLLDQILKNYESCRTYQDSGTIDQSTLFFENGTSTNRSGNFTTSFSRKKGFRFFFTNYNHYNGINFDVIIHQNIDSGWTTFYKRFNVKPPELKKLPLSSSIASATGITNGIAHFIPKNLMPSEIPGSTLFERDSLIRLKNISADGNEFYRFKTIRHSEKTKRKIPNRIKKHPELKKHQALFEHSPKTMSEKTYWFNQESLLLEKIYYTIEFPKSKSEFIIIYSPKINQKLEPHLLNENFPK